MKRTPKDRPIHKCDNCGLEQPWDNQWCWYGSIKDLEDFPDQGGILKFCTEKCKQEAELLDNANVLLKKKQADLKTKHNWL